MRTKTPPKSLAVAVAPVALALAATFLLGVSWWPWGSAGAGVVHGRGCPHDGRRVIVEGPKDRPAEDAAAYPPGRDWSLLSYADDITAAMHTATTWGAERKIKSGLPWRVRFGVEWDSEGGMLAVYGTRSQICMIARMIQHAS